MLKSNQQREAQKFCRMSGAANRRNLESPKLHLQAGKRCKCCFVTSKTRVMVLRTYSCSFPASSPLIIVMRVGINIILLLTMITIFMVKPIIALHHQNDHYRYFHRHVHPYNHNDHNCHGIVPTDAAEGNQTMCPKKPKELQYNALKINHQGPQQFSGFLLVQSRNSLDPRALRGQKGELPKEVLRASAYGFRAWGLM